MSKVTKPAPSELELLKARVAHLEDKQEALYCLQNPVTFGGKQIPRCACNKLSTRSLRVNHPTQGIHLQSLCDTCVATGFVAVLAGMTTEDRISVIEETDPKVLAYVRRINSLLAIRS